MLIHHQILIIVGFAGVFSIINKSKKKIIQHRLVSFVRS